MANPILTKSYQATSVAIAAFLIVAATTGDKVQLATGATDPLRGTSGTLGADADGMVDVDVVGIGQVRFGGTVANGDPLTSDANGKAIKALFTASTQIRIIGFATQAAVADDIGDYHIAPGLLSKASA